MGEAQGCRGLTQLFPGQHFHPQRTRLSSHSPARRPTDTHGRRTAPSRPRDGVLRQTLTCLNQTCLNPAMPQDCRQPRSRAGLQLRVGVTSRVRGDWEQPARDRPYPGPVCLRAATCTRGAGGSALLFWGIPWCCFLQTSPKLLLFSLSCVVSPSFPPFAVFNEAHAVKSPAQPELYCFAISKGTGRNGTITDFMEQCAQSRNTPGGKRNV